MTAQSDDERKRSAFVTRRTQRIDLITQEKNRLKQTWDSDAKSGVQKILQSAKVICEVVAIVACMRKFITTHNHLVKTNQELGTGCFASRADSKGQMS
jgi:hypothetical protein